MNYKISLQPDAKPYASCTPRRVPIPLMKQLKEQLEEMTRLGVIESVEEPTEWCAGIVAFGLAKESQNLTTFITPFGRFLFKGIPFGISSAPEIFQRKITQLLGKLEGVVCLMDDIVVYGSSLEEHNERVRQVLNKFQEEGMSLNPEKCQFGVKTIKFLGHTMSSEGLFIAEEKIDANWHPAPDCHFYIQTLGGHNSQTSAIENEDDEVFLSKNHIAGKKQIVADVLSRKPISKRHKDELEEELYAYIQSIEFPATEERLLEISRKQKEDSLCSQVANYCTVRSDNGPQFQKVLGSEFSRFSKEWSFKHITSSPRFPQTNGFIEAIIKNINQSLKKKEDCYLTLQAYRTMPLETLQEREKRRMINQKRLYDKRHDVNSLPQLQQGDSLCIRYQRVEGKVLHKSQEPRSYWVQTPQGKVRRNRLHLTRLPTTESTMDAPEDSRRQELRNEEAPPPSTSTGPTREGRTRSENQDQDQVRSVPSTPVVQTRYGRVVKKPQRFL
ncbi:K02A2.6-like [Cordylochernes scorpioides]|uniref:K02A2.6-like n=1 Tax=Cordylochernes scorpioides TaxID=51811 RepID=A0ABY6KJK6_9ARAC|nr:K02A2.6-like [Cordylochernes scorpioides]